MEKILEFRNTNFAYNGTNAFNDFNLEIETGEIVTMIGTSGSGKSTLLKMLCHKLPNASVYYKGLKIGSYDIETLKREIVVVFDSKIVNTSLKEEVLMFWCKGDRRKIQRSRSFIFTRYIHKKRYSKTIQRTRDVDKITSLYDNMSQHIGNR